MSIGDKTVTFFKDISRSEIILQAILVGIIAGFFVIAFNFSINFLFNNIQSFIASFSLPQKLIIFPLITTVCGLISGLLVFKFAPETKGSGIPYVKLALFRLGKGIRVRSLFVKFFSGIIGIGSGLSLGKEGPSVQIGAGVGALVAKIFNKKGSNQNNLITSGAAAALGATFNAPVSGMIFAIEELTQKFNPSLLFPVMISTVSAVSITRYFLGENPSFSVPKAVHAIQLTPKAIIVYAFLGLLAGCFGILFSKNLFANLRFFAHINKIPNWLKPAFAGLVIGVVGIFLPQILSTGTNEINSLLVGKYTLLMIFVIFIAKFIATSFCFGSGAAGGIFLPMLMLGSFLGYFVGLSAEFLGIHVNLVSISIVGMGAFLAAVARSPITAVMMVFEMTGDYNNILPVMMSVAIADLVSEKLGGSPIYTSLILRQTKITPQIKKLAETKVKDVYDNDIQAVFEDIDVKTAFSAIENSKYDIIPVKTKYGKLAGVISKASIQDLILQDNNICLTVDKIMNPEPLTVKLDDNLFKASFIMHSNDADCMFVVSNSGIVKGILTHDRIMTE